MRNLLPLVLFLLLAIIVLVATELHERRKKASNTQQDATANGGEQSDDATPDDSATRSADDGECCGQHLVCERETLLQTNAKIEYYDDEELDALAGIDPNDYTTEQHDAILHVFNTLLERDVPGWCRSLQLRHIELPLDIREEALLIVRERRNH